MPYEYRNKCLKRLFVIFFERDTSKYYFRSLKESEISVYVRINKNYFITSKKYFQVGDKVFHVEPGKNTIKIVIHNDLKKNKKGEKYTEYQFNSSAGEISIGRSEICNIKLDETILSKVHCIFNYNEKKQTWMISDGNGERKSTNGTWLFCNSKYELTDKYTFAKIGKSVIEISKEN